MLSIQTSLSWALPVYNNCRRRYLIIACCQTEQRNPQWVLYAGGAGEDLQRCVFFIGTLSHEISWFRSRAISVKPPEHEKRFERGRFACGAVVISLENRLKLFLTVLYRLLVFQEDLYSPEHF